MSDDVMLHSQVTSPPQILISLIISQSPSISGTQELRNCTTTFPLFLSAPAWQRIVLQ